jgi:hypothetical protein
MLRNILSYKHFERVAEYEDELNVVLKCTGCSHIFSPGMSDEEISQAMSAWAGQGMARV